MAFKPSKRPSSPATRREQRKASGNAALDAGRYRDNDDEPVFKPIKRPVDKFKKVLKQPFTREKGISELFGDTEMGFDFLRRSKFNPRMQAGLRDSRPMSEYIGFAPGNAVPENPTGYAVGSYSPPITSLYRKGEEPFLRELIPNASEVLGMQTPRTPDPGSGTKGSILIDNTQSARDQTRTLFHELMHKGGDDIMRPLTSTRVVDDYLKPIRMVGEDTSRMTQVGGEYGFLEDTEHKGVQSITNKAFMEEDFSAQDINLMEREVNRIFSLYLTPADKEEFYKRAENIAEGDVHTAYRMITDLMEEAPTVQNQNRVFAKNARIRQGAQNFANRFASGGIISALMEDAVT